MSPRIITSDSDLDAALVNKFLAGYVVDLTLEPDNRTITLEVTGTRRDDQGQLLVVGNAWDDTSDQPVEGVQVTALYDDITEIEVF